jgi:RNA polymerase sigma-70 factor (ECF subfamily)
LAPWSRARYQSQAQDEPAARAGRGGEVDADLAAADDIVLVAAARVDRAAFTFLYERYVRQIYRYCYLKLGDREAAADATSQVFLDAMTSLAGYRGSGPFAGWLFRIAQHTVADLQRRGRSRPTAPLEAAGDPTDPDQLPEDIATTRDELRALRRALTALPADQRAVVELQLADLTPQQIAAALGRSPNAVRVLRFRAFQRLRPLLSADAATPIECSNLGGGGLPC